jgi:LacI family transcriptional regulator
MSACREVAVILNLNKDFDRKIAVGISRYAHGAGDWRVYLEDEPGNKLPALPEWHGHGVLADLDDERVRRSVRGLPVPVVGVGGYASADLLPLDVAYVATDNGRIARLAAEHLLERGLEHFAYCGLPTSPYTSWAAEREQAFRRRLRAAGFACAVFRGRHRRPLHWDAMLDELAAWLRRQPKPLGLLACDDPRARHVLLACRRCRLRIPDDVAIVGVDNDPIMCEMARPTLTSIEQGAEQIGYEAAALLDRLMRTGRRNRPFLTVPPVGLVTRQSTDVQFVDDAVVARALNFAQEHLAEAVDPQSVAEHVCLSRGMLDIRFRRAIGRSVHGEIKRMRLDLVRKLLTTTDLPLKVIAGRAGYSSVEYLSCDFRRQAGRPPGEYRRANSTRPTPTPSRQSRDKV